MSVKSRMIEALRRETPQALRELPHWVGWSAEHETDTTGQVKTRKVPQQIHGGRVVGKARSNDPATWTTFDDALHGLEQQDDLAGIGVQFGASAEQRVGIVGIDLDACDEWATLANWLTAEFDSWCERSQSGTGRHIFVYGRLPRGIKIDKGVTAGVEHRAMEMYDHSRFFAMTGDRIGKPREIAERQNTIDTLFKALEAYDRLLKWLKRAEQTDEKQVTEFVARWNATDVSDSPSNGDWSLCGQLLRWTEGNARIADLLFRMSGRYTARQNSEKAWDSPRHGSNRHPDHFDEPLYLDRALDDALTYGEYTLGKQLYAWRKRSGERAALERQIVDNTVPRDILGTAALTEYGNGECFAALYRGKFLYNATSLEWMQWDGGKWVEDKKGRARQAALEMVRLRGEYAKIMDDETRGSALYVYLQTQCGRVQHIEHVLLAAASYEGMTVVESEFDVNETLLAAQNGVYDLAAGTFREARPDDLVMKQLGAMYDPTADCPRWRQFMREIFADDAATIAYVQRAFGYALTTSTREQVMFILTGQGANGKSLLLNTVAKVMGTYRGNASFETIQADKGGASGHNEPLAVLAGTRYVTIIESNEGKRLNEAMVKAATGGDTITASKKHGHVFNFKLAGKIFLAVNRKPRIIGTDKGIWRRIHLIEFTQTFEGERADKDLAEKLEAELSGILNWLLEGYTAWCAQGLARPENVTSAVNTYREESDAIATWLGEHAIIDSNEKCLCDEAYTSYKTWSQQMGEFTLSRNVWLERMREHGFERSKQAIKTGLTAEERVHRWHLLGLRMNVEIDLTRRTGVNN